MTQTLILISFVAYLAVMIYIGYYYGKQKTSNSSEFYLGGRQLGPLVAAMSAEASDMSSWLLMGIPGLAFITGLADPFWTVLGLGIGTYLNWLFVTRRLRRYTIRVGAVTIPEFFSKRFHDKKNILMCISAIVILIFFVPYTASGFKAVGTLLNSLFGFPYHESMIVGAIIIVAYTVMGGFMAVSTTDLIQSIVMTIALIVIVIFGLEKAGGIDVVISNAEKLPGYLDVFAMHDKAGSTSTPYGWLTIVSTMAWGLGYFGMPHILLRFMAIKNEEQIPLSRRIATVWVFISMFVAIAIGIIGYSVAQAGIIPDFMTTSDAERTIIELSNILAQYGIFAALVAGIVLAGILACTMSTADSQLLTAASSFSENILQDVMHVKVSPKTSMIIARITIAIIACVAVYLAWNPENSIFNIVAFAWAGFGAAFGPVMLASLFWKRTTLQGAICGMVAGGIMVFVWKYMVRPMGGAWDLYELLPAFIVSAAAIIIVSLCTEKPSDDINEEFDYAKE
ncbi:MAG: sodium/proline symporter [Prevotella sp.]|nr:sodium/proline symporter [Candidatus Prevotella equi]